MDINSYASVYIELPPTEKDKFEDIVNDKGVNNLYNLAKMSERSFRNLNGITPLMFVKSKELLESVGAHFGMSDAEIEYLRNKDYFDKHPSEKVIGKFPPEMPKPTDTFAEEVCNVFADEDMDYGIPEEIFIPDNDQVEELLGDSDTESASIEETDVCEALKRLERERVLAYDPIANLPPCDLEWLYYQSIKDNFTSQPWWIKLFYSKVQRMKIAVEEAQFMAVVARKSLMKRAEKSDDDLNRIEEDIRALNANKK